MSVSNINRSRFIPLSSSGVFRENHVLDMGQFYVQLLHSRQVSSNTIPSVCSVCSSFDHQAELEAPCNMHWIPLSLGIFIFTVLLPHASTATNYTLEMGIIRCYGQEDATRRAPLDVDTCVQFGKLLQRLPGASTVRFWDQEIFDFFPIPLVCLNSIGCYGEDWFSISEMGQMIESISTHCQKDLPHVNRGGRGTVGRDDLFVLDVSQPVRSKYVKMFHSTSG